MNITRDSRLVFQGETDVGMMKRKIHELIHYLFLEASFPNGVVLLTGTGIIPDDNFSLSTGDLVEISIEGIGILRNPVQ